jgi:protein-disulfide isomerase
MKNSGSRLVQALHWLTAGVGLTLSILSLINFCSVSCAETAKFSIFGLDFGLFGLIFSTGLLVVLAVRNLFIWGFWLHAMIFFSASGAEFYFIWMQKYVIGHWCPLCLSIAATVFVGCSVLLYEILRRIDMKTSFKRIALVLIFMITGFTFSLLGVSKDSEASLDFFLGKTNSPVTVYFISDWFCPACRTAEDAIENIYPRIAGEARVAFVDYPIHPATSNFTPYNLQFLAFEKDKYPALRHALSQLSFRTKTPTPDEIQAAVTAQGVKLRQMNYADILYGLQFNLTTYRGFGVKTTPSVVVANSKNRKQKIIEGARNITLPSIRAAIAEVKG